MAAENEERPLGLMIPRVAAGVEIPPEPPDVQARALSIAARLLCGATTFFFMAFVFAYFYLRSLNQNHMWRPSHVKPDQAWGAVFVGCLIVSVALSIASGRLMKGERRNWVLAAAGGLAFALAAIAAQCIEFTVQRFGPTNGAYASVFCVWLGFYLVAVLTTTYWLETQIATELRARRVPARDLDDETGADIADPDRLIAPALDAGVFYWSFLGAIGVLTYVVLYALQ